MSPKQSARRLDIEVLRVLAMFGIVVGHCFAIYGVWNTSLTSLTEHAYLVFKVVNPYLIYYALPIFVGISGYLTGSRQVYEHKCFSYKSFILGKTKRLYLPAVIFSALYLFLTGGYTEMPSLSILRALFIDGAGHLWFLYMLYVVYLLSYFVHKVCKRIGWSCILLISFGVALVSCFIALEASLLTALFYQCFFLWGYFIGEKQVSKKTRKIRSLPVVLEIVTAIAIYTIAFGGLAIFRQSNYVASWIEQCEVLYEFQHWAFRFILGGLAVGLSFRLLPLAISANKLIQSISEKSFAIYIVHQFVLIGILSFPRELLSDVYMGLGLFFSVALSIVVLASSFVLAQLLKKIPVINQIV